MIPEYKVGDRVQPWGTKRAQTGRRKRRKGITIGVILQVYLDILQIQWSVDGKENGEPVWCMSFTVEPADDTGRKQ